jgi:hypothetical protein
MNVLDPSIVRRNRRTGNWTPDEDTKLKDAVQTHGGKDWVAMSVLVPGRTKVQCYNRRNDAFVDPNIVRWNGRTNNWTPDEDTKLKDAVQTHDDKNWVAMSALVPGRTKVQCYNRWNDGMMSWVIPTSTGRINVRVNGQKAKTLG